VFQEAWSYDRTKLVEWGGAGARSSSSKLKVQKKLQRRSSNPWNLPKGDVTIARQFTAGFGSTISLSPEGTVESIGA
jgi:hypothetical protein